MRRLAAACEGLDDDHAATAAGTATRRHVWLIGRCGFGRFGHFRARRHGEQLPRPRDPAPSRPAACGNCGVVTDQIVVPDWPIATAGAAMAQMVAFFALIFLLSSPFWALSSLTGLLLLPGLPLAGLMAVCPGIAALILSHRENGTSGVKELLKRSFDYKRIAAKIWYLPILLLYPGVITPSSGVTRFTGMRLFLRLKLLSCLRLLCSSPFSSAPWEKSWAGPDMSSTQCSVAGERSGPVSSWAVFGQSTTS